MCTHLYCNTKYTIYTIHIWNFSEKKESIQKFRKNIKSQKFNAQKKAPQPSSID